MFYHCGNRRASAVQSTVINHPFFFLFKPMNRLSRWILRFDKTGNLQLSISIPRHRTSELVFALCLAVTVNILWPTKHSRREGKIYLRVSARVAPNYHSTSLESYQNSCENLVKSQMSIHNKSESAKDVVKFIVLPEDNEYNFRRQ